MIYEYDSGREAAFDIHTSWVTPDNFPGYVEQEVQFRFDNGVWNGHSRKRGVECTVEGKTPLSLKTTMNNHYNGSFLEPWGERSQRGYGIEVIERFVRELAYVEFGGDAADGRLGWKKFGGCNYNDLAADRQTVAAVQALEAILERQAAGEPDCVVRVNDSAGGLVLYRPGSAEPTILYATKSRKLSSSELGATGGSPGSPGSPASVFFAVKIRRTLADKPPVPPGSSFVSQT